MKTLKSYLTRECINFLKQNNIDVEDFIRTNDFGGVCIRQSQKAIEIYKKILRENSFRIWK